MMKKYKDILYVFGRCILCFFTVIIIMVILFRLDQYAPFGDNSLASMDANNQYLDFYSYYKDVLKGSNSIFYSFGKSLGGPMIAVFSYYLASPFTLLVYLFPKSELHTAFNLMVMLKLGLAAAIMCFFLHERFKAVLKSGLHLTIICLLSVCYALSQYCIAQSSNIMWLDGVYLLPLMLLGVYRVVQGKSFAFLALTTGISIIFNWYSGGINCIMSVIWLCFEVILDQILSGRKKIFILLRIIIRYAAGMILGVCLSAFLFLPTIAALQNSARGTLDLKGLLNWSFSGNIISVIEGYTFGAISTSDRVSLFCGGMVIISCIVLFLAKQIPGPIKAVFGAYGGLMLLIYYWRPFFLVFSLFKNAYSFHYRYSYVTIFFLVFMAGYFTVLYSDKVSGSLYIKAAAVFSFLLLLVNYAGKNNQAASTSYTVVFAMLIGMCLCFLREPRSDAPGSQKKWAVCLILMILTECLYGTHLQMRNYHTNDVTAYRNYVAYQRRQINAIKEADGDYYRIAQTSARGMGPSNLTANYDEGLAFNYMPITSYTSSPDDAQRSFLDMMGYRRMTDNISVVNTSIIGTDSLLGVKYILSSYPIRGYELTDMEAFNGKNVYSNPFALPLAFRYRGTDETILYTGDPFKFQNELYSSLIGEKTELYIPVQFTTETGEKLIRYTLELPQGNYAFYGNLPWRNAFDGKVTVNDSWSTEYAKWLSPTVFYIPTKADDDSAQITVTSNNTVNLKFGTEMFYAFDLDKFEEITNRMRLGAAESIEISSGKAHFLVNGTEGESLFISIPYDRGWRITQNEKAIVPNLIKDCLISVPLAEGTNDIELEYHVPYLKAGVGISAAAFGLLCLVMIFRKRIFCRKSLSSS